MRSRDGTVDHLLLTCVFAHTVWFEALSAWGHADWAPCHDDRLLPWCSSLAASPTNRKDINTFATLVLWETWKHRNSVVFDGTTLSVQDVLRQVLQVASDWVQAGFFKGDMAPCFVGVV